MNRLTDPQLLRDYTERRSEAAFTELVRRHVDLVYSAALRMVCDSHLAEDVTQGVFVALAQNARQLTDHPVLSGWLHRTTQNLAAKAVRSDVRRRAREQEAATMNELLSAEPNAVWEHIAPQLDAALGELGEADRDALLLRYFERKSASEMAQTLGISDEAAQKRVSRAVERLREFFAKRGLTVGASGLVVVITANAVQAAPVGLAITISTAAALTGTTLATTATVTATKAIAMTALQKTIVTATVAVLAGAGIYEARQAEQLRDQVQTLKQQQAPLADQSQQLRKALANATNQNTALRDDNERLNRNTGELLRLRGEVTRLRNERKQLATSGSETNDSKGTLMSEKITWRPEWKDAGQSSPEAALQTYIWALANNHVDRVQQSMAFDRRTNAEPVSEIFARREARQDGDKWKVATLGGVRVHRGFPGYGQNMDRASFEVEIMNPSHEGGETMPADSANPNSLRVVVGATTVPVDPANPPAWNPIGVETFNLVKVNDEWKVVGAENRLRLTIDDEDSEAVAKMMLQMDAKTLEQLKSNPRLPVRTLRAFEELKSKGTQ